MAIGLKVRNKENSKPTPTRTFSKKQEQQVAKALGGVRTPNSGATPWVKSDVLTTKFALECKTKVQSSNTISIKKEWLKKLVEESVFMGKPYSAIVFNFGPNEENHYIINEELFIKLCEVLENE